MTDLHTLAALLALRPGVEPVDPLAEMINPPAWHDQAECRGQRIELFFPVRGGTTTAGQALCAVCPVELDCLEWAMCRPDNPEGLFGGTIKSERAALLRPPLIRSDGRQVPPPPSEAA